MPSLRTLTRTLLTALAAACLHAAPAQASAASLCPDRPIRFAHYESGLLYSSGYGGIDDDFQKELALRSGCKFEISVRPRARIWQELSSGEVDMAASGIQTPERDAFAWFFHYIVEDNLVILGPKVPLEMHSFDQFVASPGLKLGGVRSYRHSPHYDRYVSQLAAAGRHHEVADPANLYRMFAAQRVDALIADPFLFLHYARVLSLPLPERVEDWDPAGPTPSGLVLAKKSFTPAQARQWQALVSKLLADGTVAKITVKHMGAAMGPKAVYRTPPR